MFKKPAFVLFLLLILTVLLVLIDLPENYHLKFSIFGRQVDRIINPISLNINLPGIQYRKEFTTKFGLDMAGGTHIVLNADMGQVPAENRVQALESAREVIERRVNFFGVSEPVVQSARSEDAYRIIVELPGITEVEQAVELIGQTAKLDFREFKVVPESTEAALFFPTFENTTSVDITGMDLSGAQLTFSPQTGEPVVAIAFTAEGAKKFSDVTTRLIGKQLAIFLDEFPVTWPNINEPITQGEAIISGGFSQDEAKTLALQLNAGALPVPVNVVEKRTIGAVLGQESIDASVQAGIIGLSIVALFMIAKYGWLGVLAVCALVLYSLISFAIFRAIPVTLTLPGIAGFLLSIGMAVDSNILIFERYAEERRRGKPWKIAMEMGFGRAWDSIRDANLTTIITALILYNPGNWSLLPSSGLVRGFAATLLIGVLVSLFTGIVVTRTLIRVFYRPMTRPVAQGA